MPAETSGYAAPTRPTQPTDPALTSTHRLADRARTDADFMQVAELYSGHANFDVALLVADLVAGEAVPFLPVLRYTAPGLRKREQWEATWALQRREDAGEALGEIPVPPEVQVHGLPEDRLLAPARRSGRAQGALGRATPAASAAPTAAWW